MRILTANAPYGHGGIGQHFEHLVEETRAAGQLHTYLAPTVAPNDPHGLPIPTPWWEPALLRYTPIRWSNAWKSFLVNDLHDRRAARQLPALLQDHSVTRLMGFVGGSLHSFRQAKDRADVRCELVAANSHVTNVRRLHARAAAETGLTDTWLNDRQYQKTLREYEIADRIFVHSEYTRQSFLDAGVSARRLERTVLCVADRFQPPSQRPQDGIFRVVYVGRVDATKGLPWLFEAVERLDGPAELTIVGGWSTRAMRKYVEAHLDGPATIRLAPGDPLPALHRADVFVHPSYEDGFGYAPMEALACGVPVIITEDTGMKEYVQNGVNGYVVPTGSVDAIVDTLRTLRRSPLAATHSLLPSSLGAPTKATGLPLPSRSPSY